LISTLYLNSGDFKIVNIPCPYNAGMFLNINGGKVHIPYLFEKKDKDKLRYLS
jgi:hypothetical protein